MKPVLGVVLRTAPTSCAASNAKRKQNIPRRRSPRPAGSRVAPVWAHSMVKGKDDSAQEVVSFVVSFVGEIVRLETCAVRGFCGAATAVPNRNPKLNISTVLLSTSFSRGTPKPDD